MYLESNVPLAERMRPSSLDALIGQTPLMGKNGIIRKAIETNTLPSMILWGPSGVGKTTIANIVANTVKIPFYTLSAINAGVKNIRNVIDKALLKGRCILFIDEIHRFNKTQQDALLGAVERGTIILIGATTENPSFEINSALLSRCQVYALHPLDNDTLLHLAKEALAQDYKLKNRKIIIKEHKALLQISSGDARKMLNILDFLTETLSGDIEITDNLVTKIAQKRVVLYDKKGGQHYDIISAFIKSIRGSDPNAAVYYLARMVLGGEDLKFIARRMVILAAEDIGNANPNALVLATSAFQAVTVIGYPEAQIILSQCALYLASSLKSNSSSDSIKNAMKEVHTSGDLPVQAAIRNAPTKMMKELNYGKGYRYAHESENNFINMEFLPEEIKGTTFYKPGNNPREKEIQAYLKKIWNQKYGY